MHIQQKTEKREFKIACFVIFVPLFIRLIFEMMPQEDMPHVSFPYRLFGLPKSNKKRNTIKADGEPYCPHSDCFLGNPDIT